MLQVEKPRAEESKELVKSALNANRAGRSCFLWVVIVTVASNISKEDGVAHDSAINKAGDG